MYEGHGSGAFAGGKKGVFGGGVVEHERGEVGEWEGWGFGRR